MSGEKAKETLEAVDGLLIFIKATCLTKDNGEKFTQLCNDYHKAVEVAKDAIDIMDHRLDVESKGDTE